MCPSFGPNSTSCQQLLTKLLPRVIEIWKKNHLVNDNNGNTVTLQFSQKLQGMTKNVGLTSSVGDRTPRFTITNW